jgi:hypothetical protein
MSGQVSMGVAEHTLNPFDPSLKKLLERLNQLNGGLLLLEHHLTDYAAAVRDNRLRPGLDHFGVGASLGLRDITASPPDGCFRLLASGGYLAFGEEFLAAATEMLRTVGAFTVAQAFEAHETFLLDCLAYQLSVDAPASSDALRKKKKLQDNPPSDAAAWRSALQTHFRSRNNRDLLWLVRRIAPAFRNAETVNTLGENLDAWYRALAIARHAITHSASILSSSEWERLGDDEQKCLAKHLKLDPRPTSQAVVVEPKAAATTLRMVGSHAFAVFKCLSIATSNPWSHWVRG